MSDIILHPCNANRVTCVPNIFIDELMLDANGEYVKIYLYLIRSLGQESHEFSISHMADDLDHTQKDIKRALQYWEKHHLLRLEYDDVHELSGIYLLDPQEAGRETAGAKTSAPQEAKADSDASAVPMSIPSPSPRRLTELKQDDTIQELLYVAERLLGHPLTATAIDAILSWYDDLGFPPELIEYLVEYCAERQHTNIRYMNQVALNWANEGIFSVTAARNAQMQHADSSFAVMNAFGIGGRKLTPPELSYIERWTQEYGFSLDIVTEACHRTILKTQKPSFEYADSILRSWHDQKITQIGDIEKLDRRHAASVRTHTPKRIAAKNNRFHNFSQRDYDYDAIEKKLLNS